MREIDLDVQREEKRALLEFAGNCELGVGPRLESSPLQCFDWHRTLRIKGL